MRHFAGSCSMVVCTKNTYLDIHTLCFFAHQGSCMKSTVAERGQVTIPKVLRDKLGIRPGTVLEFDVENGRLVAQKQSAEEAVAAVKGCLKEAGRTTDQFLRQIREDDA